MKTLRSNLLLLSTPLRKADVIRDRPRESNRCRPAYFLRTIEESTPRGSDGIAHGDLERLKP